MNETSIDRNEKLLCNGLREAKDRGSPSIPFRKRLFFFLVAAMILFGTGEELLLNYGFLSLGIFMGGGLMYIVEIREARIAWRYMERYIDWEKIDAVISESKESAG